MTTGFVDSLNAWSDSDDRDHTAFGVTMIAGAAVALAGIIWFLFVAADRRAVATELRAQRLALARLRASP